MQAAHRGESGGEPQRQWWKPFPQRNKPMLVEQGEGFAAAWLQQQQAAALLAQLPAEATTQQRQWSGIGERPIHRKGAFRCHQQSGTELIGLRQSPLQC